MDKTPQKLNEAALQIAHRIAALKDPGDIMADGIRQLAETKKEILEELQRRAKALREFAQEGDKRQKALKEQTQLRLNEYTEQHAALIQQMREAQPELKDVEFSFDMRDGTFTAMGPIGEVQTEFLNMDIDLMTEHTVTGTVKPAENIEENEQVQDEVRALLLRIGKKKQEGDQ